MTAVDNQRDFAVQTLDCWLARLAEAGIPELLLVDVLRERAQTIEATGFLRRPSERSIAPDGCGRDPADPTMQPIIPFDDVPTRVLKRAQYEAFEFELQESKILVRNESYADPENHEYEVTVEEGVPTRCTYPADARFDNPCKHRVALAIRRPILEFVDDVQVIADGGLRAEPSESTAVDGDSGEIDIECDCTALDDFPCWECYRSGKRELP
jgi:hypothetical protein